MKRIYKAWNILPLLSLTLIPFISVYYVVTLFIILWLLIFFIKKKFSKKVESLDIDNIVTGISKKDEMEKLYKTLIKKVHPDKNPSMKTIADEYTAKLNQHRYNHDELNKLANEIDQVF
jgi:hypothetical protein